MCRFAIDVDFTAVRMRNPLRVSQADTSAQPAAIGCPLSAVTQLENQTIEQFVLRDRHASILELCADPFSLPPHANGHPGLAGAIAPPGVFDGIV